MKNKVIYILLFFSLICFCFCNNSYATYEFPEEVTSQITQANYGYLYDEIDSKHIRLYIVACGKADFLTLDNVGHYDGHSITSYVSGYNSYMYEFDCNFIDNKWVYEFVEKNPFSSSMMMMPMTFPINNLKYSSFNFIDGNSGEINFPVTLFDGNEFPIIEEEPVVPDEPITPDDPTIPEDDITDSNIFKLDDEQYNNLFNLTNNILHCNYILCAIILSILIYGFLHNLTERRKV